MHTLYQMAKPEFEPTENFKCSAKTLLFCATWVIPMSLDF